MSDHIEGSPFEADTINDLRRSLSAFPIRDDTAGLSLKAKLVDGLVKYTGILARAQTDYFSAPRKRSSATELRDSLLAFAASLEQARTSADAVPPRSAFMLRALRNAIGETLRSNSIDTGHAPRPPHELPLPIEGTAPSAFLAAWAASVQHEAAEIDVPRGRTPGDDLRIDFICRSLAICWFRVTGLPPRHAQGPIKKKGTFAEFTLLLMPLILPGLSPQQIATATRRAVDEFKRNPSWIASGGEGAPP